MTKIKLCGLMRREDVEAVNEVMPDYGGFVFYPRSRRCVTEEQAVKLRRWMDPQIPAVGVFVDEDPERILSLLDRKIIQMVQLHGHEEESFIAELKQRTEAPVIQAVKVRQTADLRTAERSGADLILLDNGAGTGETFDWTMMDQPVSRPFFLAGGLKEDNVAEAIRRFRPYAVDVSSGIETGGKKDPEKIKRFVQAVGKTEE